MARTLPRCIFAYKIVYNGWVKSKLKRDTILSYRKLIRMLMKMRRSKRMLASLCKCNEISGKQAWIQARFYWDFLFPVRDRIYLRGHVPFIKIPSDCLCGGFWNIVKRFTPFERELRILKASKALSFSVSTEY